MYTAAVRKAGGAWQHRSYGKTAREARRSLAKKIGLPFRMVDGLPLGKTPLTTSGEWAEVEVRT